ncbi:MAG: hypothetical protein AMXMBFR13_49670 [Phycisphaerae bacterium]
MGSQGQNEPSDHNEPLIRKLCGALEDQQVLYAVTGSVSTSIHGEPVTCIDVDDQLAREAGI